MAYGIISSVDKTTVYIDPVTKRELAALARRSGRPQAQLLREALVQYIDRQKRPTLPSFVATSAVGGDASVDVRRFRDGSQRERSHPVPG